MPTRSKTLVMKFGGTSVGDAAAIANAVQIVVKARPDWDRIVVVTSAMAGVTNALLEGARCAAGGNEDLCLQSAAAIQSRHHQALARSVSDTQRQAEVRDIIDRLSEQYRNLCQAIAVLGEASPRALDTVAALGERMSTPLLTAALQSADVAAVAIDAAQLIMSDNHYQLAHPNLKETKKRARKILQPIFARSQVPVVTGFIASAPDGSTTTLGRGGSDYSAAILGAILSADEVWIWTDVDGVMSADPRLVAEARTIPELTYREVAELAYFGARVLHPRTIRPVIEAGIGLRVCNTFNPGHPGSRVVADRQIVSDGVIKAVTAISGLTLVTLEGRGMLGVPGVAARTFGAVAATGTSVPLISQASSEQSICFAVPLECRAKVLSELENEFAKEIVRRDIDRVWTTGEVGTVTVVGAGMSHTPGVAGRVFTTLGNAGVNVIAIAQGSSEVAISLVVAAADIQPAVRALHTLIKEF